VEDSRFDSDFRVERTEEGFVRVLESEAGSTSVSGVDAVTMSIKIPPRFCGVSVKLGAKKSHARIESIVEASLKVQTNGGGIDLGTIKGATMDLDSKGGEVRASGTVSADSRVRTGGGKVSFAGKLVGSIVYVDTEPAGAFEVESVYGDKINVNTGGGPASARSVRVGEMGLLRTGGGAVSIGGLEGAGEDMIAIDSGGGDVSIKFSERVHIVHINSRGGAIDASFPSGFSPAPYVIGEFAGRRVDGVQPLPDPEGSGGPSSPRARVVHGVDDEIARKVAAAIEGSAVTLDASADSSAKSSSIGRVSVSTTSWIAAALAAAKSARSTPP